MDRIRALRERLITNHLSYTWLIAMMRRMDYDVDKYTVSSVFTGAIGAGERVEKIVEYTTLILDKYESSFLPTIEP